MKQFFIIMAVVATLMTALTGVSTFYLSQAEIEKAQRESAITLAKGAANIMSARVALLDNTLQKMVRSPELIAAISQADLVRAKQIVQQMGSYFPDAMAFRLLLPGDHKPDTSIEPHMGYADLDLVQSTFLKPQLPLIQGIKGKNRHLAMTRAVQNDTQNIAVILASIDFNKIINSLHTIQDSRLLVELSQTDLVIASQGNATLKEATAIGIIPVAHTPWTISYWYDTSYDFSFLSLILSIILIPAFIAALVCYIYYRKLEMYLIEDQRVLLKVAKDLLLNKRPGSYPVNLQEMNHFISAIIQFKRVIDSGDLEQEDPELHAQQQKQDLELQLGTDSMFSETSEMNPSSFFAAQDTPNAQPEKEMGFAIALDDNETDTPTDTTNSTNDLTKSSTEQSTNSVFRAYDIRGIVDAVLTKELIFDIGRAIGSEAVERDIKSIALARDGRISSPTLSTALAEGILTTGVDIIDIGMVPTPVLYFAAQHCDSRSGVMLTASHNPANYNGVKVVLDGETLAGEQIQSLRKRIAAQHFQNNPAGSLTENKLLSNEYIGTLTDNMRIARPMKIVIDAGNGVAGELAPIVLKTLGCEVIELFCDIDGTFPNHAPDPSQPENYTDLIAAVGHFQADVGLCFDGDGDRLGIVDSSGKIIWPDRQMMLFSTHILAGNPGSEIIYDVKCTRLLAEHIQKLGGRASIWKTGHSFMKARLKETGAIFAGEMSGHLFFNDRWYGFDDGIYAAARLMEILSEDSRTSAEVFADFPDSINTPEINIPLDEGVNMALIKQLLNKANFPDGRITDIDGLRVDFADGFGLVRASNTTPALVVRFEGDNQAALTRIQTQFRQLLLEVKADLSLPF